MRFRTTVPALAGLFVFLGLAFLLVGRPDRVAGQQTTRGHSGHAAMTDAAMERWAQEWWATHPRVGKSSNQAAAATYTVANFRFDADGNPGTLVDTVQIIVGEAVMWQWVSGIHSITNGTGAEDPDMGSLFDQPSSISNQQFTFTFNTAGTFPFFCRPHELDNMRGVVKVVSAVSVEPVPGGPLGFTGGPWPNPTRAGMSFGFALRHPGRVRAEVFDARGRHVATVLDREVSAGPHVGAWDGRAPGGALAGNGLYYLRLRLPGYDRSRAIVIAR